MTSLAGIFAPIVTPFTAEDALDLGAMQRNVARWMRTSLQGLVVLGSTGEAAQLEEDEADRVIDTVRQGVPRDRLLIAGTGRESTRATIAATRRAAAAGVDAVLVRTPAFFKSQMTTEVFIRHYTEVADASPVPLLLYNVTMFTGVNLLPDAVEHLGEHPNIVGMKESGGDIAAIGEVVDRTPDDFIVLAGSATTFFHALCAGCAGGVLALATLVPDEFALMQQLVTDRRLVEARHLQRRLMPLARLGGKYGVAGLKTQLDAAGYEGGFPRPPLRPVTSAAAAELTRALEAVSRESVATRS